MRKREMDRLLRIAWLRVDESLHELGVPNEDYPAPVANAVDNLGRLRVLLAAWEPREVQSA
jgi:hypothetical protein